MTAMQLNELLRCERAQVLLDLYQRHGHAFNRVNLSTFWSSLGRVSAEVRCDDARLLPALEQTCHQVQLHTFEPRHVSNIAHALAKLDVQGREWTPLWSALSAAALARIKLFNPQDLANTAWAFATAGCATPALFDAIAAESERRVLDFSPQGLANTAWAFATAGRDFK